MKSAREKMLEAYAQFAPHIVGHKTAQKLFFEAIEDYETEKVEYHNKMNRFKCDCGYEHKEWCDNHPHNIEDPSYHEDLDIKTLSGEVPEELFQNNDKDIIDNLPLYVWMGKNNTALRLLCDETNKKYHTSYHCERYNGLYYRDGGDWAVGYKVVGRELHTADFYNGEHPLLVDNKLTPCTEEEWFKDNEPYVDRNGYRISWSINSSYNCMG